MLSTLSASWQFLFGRNPNELSKEEMASYKDQLLSMSTADEVEAFIREKTNQ